MLKFFFCVSLCLWSIQSASSCGELADKRCRGCEVANVCKDCYESYWDATSKTCKVPTTKLDYCLSYTNETTCKECHLGYYVSAGKCVKITISGCGYFEPTTQLCLGCVDQKLVAMDFKSCTSTKCSDSNCLFCTQLLGIQACGYCKKGFVSNLATCVADSKNSNMIEDGECRYGFYMNKNVCAASDLIPELNFGTSFSNLLGLFIFTVANSLIFA